MTIVDVQNLSFAYPGTPVLSDASFTIARGDFVCMVGPNGGGKTTLLRLMLGLLKPQSGSIRIFDKSPEEARRRIGYMPQRAQLDPAFPVRAIDVALMGRLGPMRIGPFNKADRKRALEALAEVGLADCATRSFAALSGGQRQRVLIARALACDPELLLMDEPAANLDPLVQDEMNDLLHELNTRLSIVLVSHDVGFVTQHVQTVLCVNRKVWVHAAGQITGDSIRNLYGHDVHMVHHGHDHCCEHKHEH